MKMKIIKMNYRSRITNSMQRRHGRFGYIIVTTKISSYLTSLNYYYYYLRVTQHLYFIVECRLPTTFAIYTYPYPPLKRVQSFSSICFCFFSLLFYPLPSHCIPMSLRPPLPKPPTRCP